MVYCTDLTDYMNDSSEAWHHHLRLSPLWDFKERLWIQQQTATICLIDLKRHSVNLTYILPLDLETKKQTLRGLHVCMLNTSFFPSLCVDYMKGWTVDKHALLFIFLC